MQAMGGDYKDIERIFFVGIGGIGMSTLARYFLAGGYPVAGYDRTATPNTDSLMREGCEIVFSDNVSSIPESYRQPSSPSALLVIYTPAIPSSSAILSFFRQSGYRVVKRSEVLGHISEQSDALAVAGTHGKTTVSAMLAHILKISHLDCTAFLGGISKNYDSNLILGEGPLTVMEADEFDRSFHRLSPMMAVVTSMDADHLDVYGTFESMVAAYNEFIALIRAGGALVVHKRAEGYVYKRRDLELYSYGVEDVSDYYAFNLSPEGSYYRFNMKTPAGVMKDIHLGVPGALNVENAVAASALAMICGVSQSDLRKALLCYRGVKRRFDLRVSYPGLVYIDDYAHHPEEIKACVASVREQYPGRHITGIFQPHLYSRTRDHAETFAGALDMLDDVILMPVYPAREEPIPGVESSVILEKMRLKGARIAGADSVLDEIDYKRSDVIITIGAGDIDRLVKPLEERIGEEQQ